MRRVSAIVIALCVIYFVGGWIASKLGWVTANDYFAYAGIVGGLASVFGLVSLLRPGITASDIQSIEASALQSIATTSAQLEELRNRQKVTQEELGGLELKKKEMEFLVKKASLAIFLREQHAYHERVILEEVDQNSRLRNSLAETIQTSKKIEALEEEIESHPNVVELREIIATASKRVPTIEEAMQSLPPYFRSIYQITLVIERFVRSLVKF